MLSLNKTIIGAQPFPNRINRPATIATMANMIKTIGIAIAGMKYKRPVTISQMPNKVIPRLLLIFILHTSFLKS
jgi:hypothetical protein